MAHGGAKAQVVYDPAHHVVLFHEGCCTYDETVLAFALEPPYRDIARADLHRVRTKHGIGLGARPGDVIRAYGPAAMHRSTRAAALNVLSSYRDQHLKGSSCGWFDNFVFRAGRVAEIHAGHGC